MESTKRCIICKSDDFSSVQQVFKKGRESMLRNSKNKNFTALYNELVEMDKSNVACYVHFECRGKLREKLEC